MECLGAVPFSFLFSNHGWSDSKSHVLSREVARLSREEASRRCERLFKELDLFRRRFEIERDRLIARWW